MLATISPLENNSHEVVENFPDVFSDGNLLEEIDFDDLFVGFDDRDVLPDLEVDPNEILGEFSVGSGSCEESGTNSSPEVKSGDVGGTEDREGVAKDSKHVEKPVQEATRGDRDRKSTGATSAKNSQGKRKVKVDWTPELHRRFVQAVEQLGVDKAVPSRILEIMGIDCLTRHNIASHLQKYRSHRKHLMAREAEAASWSHRRRMYGSPRGHIGGHKKDMTTPWLAPTIGFPPPVQHFRPLHVWGHPTVDHAIVHAWPKHLIPSRPSPQWTPQHHPPDSFWHHPHYPRGHMPNPPTQGTPCFPQTLPPPPMRYPTPAVVAIPPPHPMYRPDNTIPLPSKQLHFDLHPSKESVDAAIGDVLSKPWLPLPLGLKPPSVDSVLVELQRQGIAKIPPSCSG